MCLVCSLLHLFYNLISENLVDNFHNLRAKSFQNCVLKIVNQVRTVQQFCKIYTLVPGVT